MGFLTTWGMREIYRRTYRESLPWGKLALMVVAVSLAGAGIQAALALGFHDFFDYEEKKIFKDSVVFAVVYFRAGICFAWSFLYFGIRLWQEKTARELRFVRIESEKKGAELQMLRAQLNPHFLFNALTSIRAGMADPKIDVKLAIQSLADFLRYCLEHRRDDLVKIDEELEAVESYLIVEKTRFREDLEFDLKLGDDLRHALVPGVFLQPMVENAVKYGWKSAVRPLRVRVRSVRLEQQLLRLDVSNTGQWIEPTENPKIGGVGLGNLRRRLELLYPGKHNLEILTDGGWVTVRLEIPLIFADSPLRRDTH
jgi:LytS/YehU family sensor histidine kinase